MLVRTTIVALTYLAVNHQAIELELTESYEKLQSRKSFSFN